MRAHTRRGHAAHTIHPCMTALAPFRHSVILYPAFAPNAGGKSELLEQFAKLDKEITGPKNGTLGIVSTKTEINAHKADPNSDIGRRFIEADWGAKQASGRDIESQGLLQPDTPMIEATALKIKALIAMGLTRIAIDSPRSALQTRALTTTWIPIHRVELTMTEAQCLQRTLVRQFDGQNRSDDAEARNRYHRLTQENAAAIATLPLVPRLEMSAMLPPEKKILLLAQFMGYNEDQIGAIREILRHKDHEVTKRIAYLENLDRQAATGAVLEHSSGLFASAATA